MSQEKQEKRVQSLNEAQLEELRNSVRGDILLPKDPEYDKCRKGLWNVMHHEKEPLVIVQPRGPAAVAAAVKFAVKHSIPLTVKGGGHNSSGRSLIHQGMVIDLGKYMRSVRVDPANNTVYVEGGATWEDVDYETSSFGLAVPGGVVSETGIGGLTLGGGWGWLTKQHGLSIDNLLLADMVLADGSQVTASPMSNEDLFWAIKGGGANFGVVTGFLFRAHRISPIVYGGAILFPIAKVHEVIDTYNKIYKSFPKNAVVYPAFSSHPGDPNERVLIFLFYFEGPQAEAEKVIQPLLDHGPVLNIMSEKSHPEMQKFINAFTPSGRYYWKAGFVPQLSPEILDLALDCFKSYPSPLGGIIFEDYFPNEWGSRGGTTSSDSFPHRRKQFCMLLDTSWADPKDDKKCLEWVKTTYARMEKHFVGSYLNFSPDDEDKVFAGNREKLLQVKRKYDPSNLFCHTNNNLLPPQPTG